MLWANVHVAGSLTRPQTLTQMPPAANEWTRSAATRADLDATFRTTALQALTRATDDNHTLLEIEYPPLLASKTQFDDFSNVEQLDANRDLAVELAAALTPQHPEGSLWLVFPDEEEARLAQEAWPGQRFQQASVTCITEACTALDRQPALPLGTAAAAMATGVASLLDGGRTNAASPAPPALPDPSLFFAVQPGDAGPMEDWLNLETLSAADAEPARGNGVPLVCFNGALDKVRSGYYPAIFFPRLAQCVDRFYSRFEAVYYLRPLSGRGFLFRVYPEPWQLVRQTKTELVTIETYETRPSLRACVERLSKPDT